MDKTALKPYDAVRGARALTQLLAGTWFLNEGKQMIDRGQETVQSSIEGKPRATTGNAVAAASRAAGLLLLLSPAAHGAGLMTRGATWTAGKAGSRIGGGRLAREVDQYGKGVSEALHNLGKKSDLKIPLPITVPMSMGVPLVLDAYADKLRGKPVPNIPGVTGWLQEKLFGKVVPDTGADTDIKGTLQSEASSALDKLKHPRNWLGIRKEEGSPDGEKTASYDFTHTRTTESGTYDLVKLMKLLEDRPSSIIDLPSKGVDRSSRTGFSAKRYAAADTDYPIILDEATGVVLDGRHRVLKLRDKGAKTVSAVYATPEDLEAARVTDPDASLSKLVKTASQEKEAVLPLIGAGVGYGLMALFAYWSAKQMAQGVGQTASGIGAGDWKKTLGGLGNTAIGAATLIPTAGTAIRGVPAIMARLYRGQALRQGMKIAPELSALYAKGVPAGDMGQSIARSPGMWSGFKSLFSQPGGNELARLKAQVGNVQNRGADILATPEYQKLVFDPHFQRTTEALSAMNRMNAATRTTGQFVRTAEHALTPAPVAWGMNQWDKHVAGNLQKVPGVGKVLPGLAGAAGWLGSSYVVDKLAPQEEVPGEETPKNWGDPTNPANPVYRRLGQAMQYSNLSPDDLRRRLYQPVQAVS